LWALSFDGDYAVTVAEVGEEPLSNGFVVHALTEALEICQRFGVALPSLLGVAPDNLLETRVLGHDKPPLGTLVPQ